MHIIHWQYDGSLYIEDTYSTLEEAQEALYRIAYGHSAMKVGIVKFYDLNVCVIEYAKDDITTYTITKGE